jgi:hypothetical protein
LALVALLAEAPAKKREENVKDIEKIIKNRTTFQTASLNLKNKNK